MTRKTKTKVINSVILNQLHLEANTRSRREARENVRNKQVTLGFSITTNWLRSALNHGFFEPMTKRCNAKPKQMGITSNNQEKKNRSKKTTLYTNLT